MKPYHKYARLGRPEDKLPWGNRLFGHGSDYPGYEIVDPRDVLAAALVRDGSIVLEDPKEVTEKAPPPQPEAEPAPAESKHLS